jgi:hypothetical protein
MTTLPREVREFATGRVRRLRVMAGRAMPGPLLVRLTVWMSALASLALAYPLGVLLDLRGVMALIVVAALPALAPHTRVVSSVLLVAAAGWLAGTTYYAEPITPWRLIAVAGALYLTHTGAALAAVLPYDTVVSPRVLTGWLLRAGAVIAATAAFALLALAGAARLGDATSVVAAVLGVVAVVPLGWLLARVARGSRENG